MTQFSDFMMMFNTLLSITVVINKSCKKNQWFSVSLIPTDSENNLESDGSEDHNKERVKTQAASDGDRPVLKSPEPSASTFDCSSLNCSPNCSLLNQKITEPLVLSCKCLLSPVINTEPLNKRDDPSSSVTFKTTPGNSSLLKDKG